MGLVMAGFGHRSSLVASARAVGLGCLVGVGLVYLGGLRPIVRFVQEEIDVGVYPEHVEVQGDYLYRNPWPVPVTQGMLIPLPVDERHPHPIEITLEQTHPVRRQLALRDAPGCCQFELPLAPFGEARVRLSYRQYARDRTATYILTTTQPWRRPLELGHYRLRLNGVSLVHSSYDLPLAIDGPVHACGFVAREFMPHKDWHIAWETE